MFNTIMNTFVAALLVLLLAGTLYELDQPVEVMRIESDLSEGQRSQVQAILSRQRMGGLLSFDITDLRKTLESMGWAREIQISRQWPNVLAITLLRKHPIARWGNQHFVTASSDIVSLPDTYPQLPLFEVELSDAPQTMRVYRLIDQMVGKSDLDLRHLAQDERGEWEATFAQGFTVKLGVDRLGERLEGFLSVYEKVLIHRAHEIAYIDVRYASGAAVRFISEDDESVLVASNE